MSSTPLFFKRLSGPEAPLLYKYRRVDKHSLHLLASNQIFFANVAQFNDPFEGQVFPIPSIGQEGTANLGSTLRTAVKGVSWDRNIDGAFETMLSRLPANVDHAALRSEVGKIFEMRYRFRDISDEAFELRLMDTVSKVGLTSAQLYESAKQSVARIWSIMSIFTISSVQNDMLMFAHYADDHRGFCIEFDFSRDETLRDCCHPVDYSPSYPTVEWELHFDPGKDAMRHEAIRAIFLTKSKHWDYEREWRIIRFAMQGLQPIDPEIIRAITFGYRMPPEERLLVQRVVRGQHVQFREALLGERNFELEVRNLEPN